MSSTDKIQILPPKMLFRPDEIAEFMGVAIRTVYVWHDEGKLEGINPTGRCLRFPRHCVIHFLKTTAS